MNIKSISNLYNDVDEDGMAPMDYMPELNKALQRVGGWRGLFDAPSHEFKISNIKEKWSVIELMKSKFDCKFSDLVYLFICEYNQKHNYYIGNDIVYSVAIYAEHFAEASTYYKNCQHPMFEEFKSRRGLHWKKSLVLNLINSPIRLCKASLKLLRDS